MKRKIFRSRISILLLGFISTIFIVVSIPMFLYKSYYGMYILGGSLLFIVFILRGTRYVIFEDTLYLQMWVFPNGNVNIMDIVSVERTCNPLSAPAASIKRLRIRFKKGGKYSYILISPIREMEFIEELKAINPNIRINVPLKKGLWRFWDWDI